MHDFKMPDITPAQVVALVGTVIAVLVSFGVDLNQGQQDSVMQLVAVVAGLLFVSDAAIRHGRSKIAAAQVEAKTVAAATTPFSEAVPATGAVNDGDDSLVPPTKPRG